VPFAKYKFSATVRFSIATICLCLHPDLCFTGQLNRTSGEQSRVEVPKLSTSLSSKREMVIGFVMTSQEVAGSQAEPRVSQE